jgi:hypothetical protein
LFAWCARDRVRLDGVWAQPSVTLVAIFVVLVRIPVALYLHLAHPHWSWLYLLDGNKIPRLTVVPILAVASGAILGGWYLGARVVRLVKEERYLLGGLAGTGAILLLITFLVRGRILQYGSYDQFHAGRSLPLGDVKLGYVLISVVVGMIASIALVGFELKRDGRRAASR